MFFNPDFGPLLLGLNSTPIFLALSAASWHLIEKPALRLKPKKKQLAVLVYENSGTKGS